MFNKGDKVRCVYDDDYHGPGNLIRGEIYEVVELDESPAHMYITIGKYSHCKVAVIRFELVDPTMMSFTPKPDVIRETQVKTIFALEESTLNERVNFACHELAGNGNEVVDIKFWFGSKGLRAVIIYKGEYKS